MSDPSLTWFYTVPTTPGWYWWQETERSGPVVVCVYFDDRDRWWLRSTGVLVRLSAEPNAYSSPTGRFIGPLALPDPFAVWSPPAPSSPHSPPSS